jgi:hypothetical protein
MSCYRLQVAIWYDSLAPKDAMCIDPVFNIAQPLGGSDDPQTLCNDLALAMKGWISQTTQIRTRAYVLPYVRGAGHVGEAFQNKSLVAASPAPRELAICLSFYADENKPRKRGRLYIPAFWASVGTLPNRPTTTMQNSIIGIRGIFTGLGGVNVDWSVWSTRDSTHRAVQQVWVDDEWDVVRSRGLVPTSRVQASTSEADIPNLVALQAPAQSPEPAPVEA